MQAQDLEAFSSLKEKIEWVMSECKVDHSVRDLVRALLEAERKTNGVWKVALAYRATSRAADVKEIDSEREAVMKLMRTGA